MSEIQESSKRVVFIGLLNSAGMWRTMDIRTREITAVTSEIERNRQSNTQDVSDFDIPQEALIDDPRTHRPITNDGMVHLPKVLFPRVTRYRDDRMGVSFETSAYGEPWLRRANPTKNSIPLSKRLSSILNNSLSSARRFAYQIGF